MVLEVIRLFMTEMFAYINGPVYEAGDWCVFAHIISLVSQYTITLMECLLLFLISL